MSAQPSGPTAYLSDEHLRSLVAHLDVAVVLRQIDPPRYIYVSPAFERIFGWPVQSLMEDPFFLRTHAHPDDRDEVSAQMADMSHGPIPELEWRIIRPDGEVRWVRAKRALVDTELGQPAHLVGFIEDITDRKTVEHELQRNRDWFEAIAAAVPIGFSIRDQDTLGYEYVSPAYESIFGLPQQSFYDDPVVGSGMLHPDDASAAAASYESAAQGNAKSYEARVIRPDGEVRRIRGHHVATTDQKNGRWMACTVEDVTSQRVIEEQLRSLVEANIVGVALSDRERVIDANDRYLEILGYTREDMLHDRVDWNWLTPPEWANATQAALAEVHSTGACAPYEKEYFTKDGSRVPVLVGNAIVDRHPMRFSSVVLDLTEVKRAEVALRQAEADALRANEAKNAFLGRMSHELRTPLNAVIGFGQLLALDELDADQREGVEQIIKGGNHLLALINEVLDISRIESGDLRLSLEPVQLAEVVNEALALVGHLGDARQVRIGDRCPPSCATYVRADRQRLRQVVLNLLANAIKYNKDSGTVGVHCEKVSDTRVRLVVVDTGIGINEDGMSRLFMPFDRLGAEHTEVEGTGLGLTLTKRLVEAMNGAIGAKSAVGHGSTFWVELDLDAPATSEELSVVEPYTLEVHADRPRAKVLYIEDNQANTRLVQRILAMREGVEAMVTMQASLGLDLARTHLPDLILLDLNLPDMPGAEALRRLQADLETKQIPVVIVSADATPGLISRLKAEGAVDYLAKPFDIAQLLALVDELALGVQPAPVGEAPPAG
ncbi:MAG: PAS domain S-box protein [Actinomycetales bacterium]